MARQLSMPGKQLVLDQLYVRYFRGQAFDRRDPNGTIATAFQNAPVGSKVTAAGREAEARLAELSKGVEG